MLFRMVSLSPMCSSMDGRRRREEEISNQVHNVPVLVIHTSDKNIPLNVESPFNTQIPMTNIPHCHVCFD